MGETMKNRRFKLKIRKGRIQDLDDSLLLLNLYLTQGITLAAGLVLLWVQGIQPFKLLVFPDWKEVLVWGGGAAAVILLADILLSRFVPEQLVDDGGINERLFGKRAVWQILLLSFVVAICEELLFRGAIQHAIGPYWTSILFAAIHARYLHSILLTGMVFATSYALGWIYVQSGTLWAPIAAHFLLDAINGLMIRFRRES